MKTSQLKKEKSKHKTPVKKIPKPAVDFDRDKNMSYIPQDESLDPLMEYPHTYETDVERPISDDEKNNEAETFQTDQRPATDQSSTDV